MKSSGSMETKQLGKTGVSVSAIGLGGMPMSIYNRPPESDSIPVIHRALDLGITFIDTADSYKGYAENPVALAQG